MCAILSGFSDKYAPIRSLKEAASSGSGELVDDVADPIVATRRSQPQPQPPETALPVPGNIQINKYSL